MVAILLVFVLVPAAVVSAAPAAPPSVSCQSAIVIDAKTGNMLWGKNETDKIWPASTTKIMTCILAIESGKLDEEVTCGKEVLPFSNASSLFKGENGRRLAQNEKVKLLDLVYGMLLVSGNDAAAATAVFLGSSIEGFADMMNDKAKELGMDGTNFVTPHGTQNDNHYSTAADMAKLAKYCMQNETFRKIVNTKEYTVPATNKYNQPRKFINTNKLLSNDPDDAQYNYDGTIGIKTGLTPMAKGCLIADAVKNNMDLIICIYNDGDAVSGMKRWGIAKTLFDYGFNNFVSVDITSKVSAAKIEPLDVGDGNKVEATPVFSSGDKQYCTVEKDKATELGSATLTATPNWTRTEDFKKGDEIGTVEYKMGETVVATAALKAQADFDKPVIATNEPPPSNSPASPSDPGYTEAKNIKDTSVVAIVIVIVVLVAGVVMLVVLLMRRRKKNAIYNRNARRRRGRSDYYNYKKRF